MLFDVLVIGAGFGGLGAALTLAEGGARVVLCEALRYPGGCASTFSRGGWRFESGATLFSGFDEGQPFHRWIVTHRLPVETRVLDPVIELRAGEITLEVPPERERFVARLCALPGAPVERLRAFFSFQRDVADTLWALFDDPNMLPPLDLRALARHALRVHRYAPLLPCLGRPLVDVLDRFELRAFLPLRVYLDAVCQITVQTGVMDAEAPFALSAVDYCFRGTRHVHGGIGELAWALTRALGALGADVRMSDGVRSLRREGNVWVAQTRRGEVRARTVIANLLPQNLRALTVGIDGAKLEALEARVAEGWGAAMLYLGLAGDTGLREEAHHLELVDDVTEPFLEGNHVFVSVSARDETDRGPEGARVATVSTHLSMHKLLALAPEAQERYVRAVQERMERTIARRAPEVSAAVVHRLTASPRTFERFTGRFRGYVGGVVRRAGLQHYENLCPAPVAPELYLVGDSVFPGQSTLATALGGMRVAARVLRG
jgi:phytoene dehydrogenase-like protein